MDRIHFYKKIDQFAAEWYIDAHPPVKSNWSSPKHPKGVARRKTNSHGELEEVNQTSGEVQIMKWAHTEQFCQNCCKMVHNRVEDINLEKKVVKCNCGLKYPICLDKLLMNSK